MPNTCSLVAATSGMRQLLAAAPRGSSSRPAAPSFVRVSLATRFAVTPGSVGSDLLRRLRALPLLNHSPGQLISRRVVGTGSLSRRLGAGDAARTFPPVRPGARARHPAAPPRFWREVNAPQTRRSFGRGVDEFTVRCADPITLPHSVWTLSRRAEKCGYSARHDPSAPS